MSTPMVLQIAEGLKIRRILHTGYTSTRAKWIALGLRAGEEARS